MNYLQTFQQKFESPRINKWIHFTPQFTARLPYYIRSSRDRQSYNRLLTVMKEKTSFLHEILKPITL